MSTIALNIHCPKCGSGQVEVYMDAIPICICMDCEYGDEINKFDCEVE